MKPVRINLSSFTPVFLYFCISSCLAWASIWPPADHNGQNLYLNDGDIIWGRHTNIYHFEVAKGAQVKVLLFNPDEPNSGEVEIYATHIIIHGTINAQSAGFTGGGGASDKQPGTGRYPGFSGPSQGDGLAAGTIAADGGYNTPGQNTDTSQDADALIGSGGGGGGHVPHPTSLKPENNNSSQQMDVLLIIKPSPEMWKLISDDDSEPPSIYAVFLNSESGASQTASDWLFDTPPSTHNFLKDPITIQSADTSIDIVLNILKPENLDESTAMELAYNASDHAKSITVNLNNSASGGSGGGGGGGDGGGAVKLFAVNTLQMNGSILTKGALGGNGQNGADGQCYTVRCFCFPQTYCARFDCWEYSCSNGISGNGGSNVPLQTGKGGTGGRNWSFYSLSYADDGQNGGAGAGGGVVLYCHQSGGLSLSGSINALGGRNGKSNGGSVKMFYRDSLTSSPDINAGRFYKHNLALGEVLPPDPTIFPRFIHVPKDYPTIQTAIDATKSGDTVVVAPGRYLEHLVISGRSITIQSSNPDNIDVVSNTIIDGDVQDASIVTFIGSLSDNSVLNGFTIKHGFNKPAITGDGANIHIANNHFENNDSDGIAHMNGIFRDNFFIVNKTGIFDCTGEITGNHFSANQIGMQNCSGIMSGNDLSQNKIAIINFKGHCTNNLIYSNDNLSGQAAVSEIEGVFEFNTVAFNQTLYHTTAGVDMSNSSTSSTLRFNIIWGNQVSQNTTLEAQFISNHVIPSYSCIQHWESGGIGNISSNPVFVESDKRWFFLMSDSPAIDVDQPDPFIVDACLPLGLGTERPDMGAFGGPGNCIWMIYQRMLMINHIIGRNYLFPNIRQFLDRNGDGNLDTRDVIMINE